MTAKRSTYALLAALLIATPALADPQQVFVIINSKLTPVGDGTAGSAAMPVSGGSSGVSTFNGRNGSVVLLSTDISGAGGLLAANNLSDLLNPATARANLLAAGSGVNSDITQLTGLTTALSPSQGGTGVSNSGTIQVGGNFRTLTALQFDSTLATANQILYTSAAGVVSTGNTLPSNLTIPSAIINNAAITAPTIAGASINTSAFNGTIVAATISGTMSGGTYNSPTINNPTITGLNLSGVTITNLTQAGTTTFPDGSTWGTNGLVATASNNMYIPLLNVLGALVIPILSCNQLKTNVGGDVLCSVSDRRLKNDLGEIDDTRAMLALENLQPHRYSYKPGSHFDGGQEHYGFMAQDIQGIFPELIHAGPSKDKLPGGELRFERDEMVAILWKQNQHFHAQQLEDESKIATLEKENLELSQLLPKTVHLRQARAAPPGFAAPKYEGVHDVQN